MKYINESAKNAIVGRSATLCRREQRCLKNQKQRSVPQLDGNRKRRSGCDEILGGPKVDLHCVAW